MGEELPLARKKKKRQPVLLVRTGTGEFVQASSSRNKRKKKLDAPEACNGEATKDTPPKSKSRRKAKGVDARTTRPEGHGRDNQDRESDRGDEGVDSKPRRTAQELGITYPGSHCDELMTRPHRWKEISKECKGILLKCSKCYRHLWLPSFHYDAEKLGNLMREQGKNEGYCIYLNRHREAKILMAKMQELERLSMEVTDKVEFAKMADRILSMKDYDRK